MTQVVQRYQYTEAGRTALKLLAEQHAKAGHHLLAMLCLEQLLKQPHSAKVLPKLLFQASSAARLAGEIVGCGAVAEAVANGAGKRPRDAEEWEDELKRIKITRTEDWPLFRGNAVRNRLSPAGVAKVKATTVGAAHHHGPDG